LIELSGGKTVGKQEVSIFDRHLPDVILINRHSFEQLFEAKMT